MGFKCGIVGLPNVGKSTLFNALTETAAAQAANYPFCTIEPNVGEVAVPDPRLDKLAKLAKSAEIIPTRLTFVDIAGLVRGASKGEGLGNQFLANIREVDAIAHVVRCFEDADVTHVEGKIDPIADIETIETELMLADLDSLEKRVDALEKKAQGRRQGGARRRSTWSTARSRCCARASRRALVERKPEEEKLFHSLGLLTVDAGALRLQCRGGVRRDRQCVFARGRGAREGGRRRRGRHLGQDRIRNRRAAARGARGLSRGSRPQGARPRPADPRRLRPAASRDLFHRRAEGDARLDHHARARKAPQAAGVIHTDFEHGFIRAETIAYDDYVATGGEAGARDAGKLRLEGKDYVVADGDVMHFRFAT